jgi:hypothetical protein
MTDIAGEVLDAADLEDSDELFSLALPDGVDERRLLDELYADLYRGEHAKAVLAEAETRRVIEWQSQVQHRPVEGLGQTIARVPLEAFLYWQAREGPDFWHQESNVDYFKRLNPGLAPVQTMRPTIVVDHKLPATGTMTETTGRAGEGLGVAPPAARSTPVRGRRGRWAA